MVMEMLTNTSLERRFSHMNTESLDQGHVSPPAPSEKAMKPLHLLSGMSVFVKQQAVKDSNHDKFDDVDNKSHSRVSSLRDESKLLRNKGPKSVESERTEQPLCTKGTRGQARASRRASIQFHLLPNMWKIVRFLRPLPFYFIPSHHTPFPCDPSIYYCFLPPHCIDSHFLVSHRPQQGKEAEPQG